MTQSSRIIFFGNERLSSGFEPTGAPTLSALITNGYDIAAVVANNHDTRSRSKRQLEVQQVAQKHNIPVLLPEKLSDIQEQLAAYKADVGVLLAYGKFIPESIINLFPHGIVNIHPSLLPQYRGPTPIEQAMLDDAKQTGVSLMLLTKGMDSGPVYAQVHKKLTGHESKADLTQELLALGASMLIEKLPAILAGTLQPVPQDESKATFSRLFVKEDGILDLSKPAARLEREARAYLGWPKSRANLHDQLVVVTNARVAASAADGALVLTCGHNTFLEIQELIAPSGRTVSGADFLRGYKKTAP